MLYLRALFDVVLPAGPHELTSMVHLVPCLLNNLWYAKYPPLAVYVYPQLKFHTPLYGSSATTLDLYVCGGDIGP